MSPAPIGLRGVRAAVFGATSLLLAAVAHVLAGGPLPSVSVLVAVGVPTACAAVVLARRSRGPLGILAVLALGQVLLHWVFMAAAATTTCAAVPAAHAGHGAQAASCANMPAMTGAASPVATSAVMVVAHIVAVLATGLLLAHGESTAQRIWTWLRPRPTFRDVRAPATGLPALAFAAPQHVPNLLLIDDVPRRGPPRTAALVTTFA